MLSGFESLVEERILKAQKNGELDNLPGQGKPLNLEDMNIPEEFRMVHRILKNSGFLPPEVELRKQIRDLENMLESLEYKAECENYGQIEKDDKQRSHIKKKLDFLILKLNMNRGSNCPAFPATYKHKLLKKML